jgi:hypothetical protein
MHRRAVEVIPHLVVRELPGALVRSFDESRYESGIYQLDIRFGFVGDITVSILFDLLLKHFLDICRRTIGRLIGTLFVGLLSVYLWYVKLVSGAFIASYKVK